MTKKYFFPENWNLSISDLMDEIDSGKRESASQQEFDWAREYERSLIPDDVRFPQKWDVYESLVDQMVHYMTAWAAPFTGGGKAMLNKGDRVWVDTSPGEDRPIGVYVLPVDYKIWKRGWSQRKREKVKNMGAFISSSEPSN